jgi:hypothetical protein
MTTGASSQLPRSTATDYCSEAQPYAGSGHNNGYLEPATRSGLAQVALPFAINGFFADGEADRVCFCLTTASFRKNDMLLSLS